MPMRTSRKVVAATIVATALGMVPAAAQPRINTGNAERGQAIAERLCATCHAVTAQGKGTASSDILSFPAIAVLPNATAEYLAGRIIVPHPAMPDIALDIREIRDVIAYILSLKTAKAP